MGLQGKAALVGAAQYKPEKYASAPRMFHLDQVAELAGIALADAGLGLQQIDRRGLACRSSDRVGSVRNRALRAARALGASSAA